MEGRSGNQYLAWFYEGHSSHTGWIDQLKKNTKSERYAVAGLFSERLAQFIGSKFFSGDGSNGSDCARVLESI